MSIKTNSEIEKMKFGFGQFIELEGQKLSCTLTVDEFYFIEEFNPGPDEIQPHN